MEDKWDKAKKQADEYHKDLLEMTEGSDNQEAFEGALNGYHNVYNRLGDLIDDNREKPQSANEVVNGRNQEELLRLRNVTVDQHRIINELQQQLKGSSSADEQKGIINQLEQEIEKQQRFMQESDTCIQLLEQELEQALKDNERMEDELGKMPKLQVLVARFTAESKAMLKRFNTLEQENKQLEQLLTRTVKQAPAPAANTNETLQLKTELQQIKEEYAQLEERYLDIKMQG